MGAQETLLRLLAVSAYRVYTGTLIGVKPPIIEDLQKLLTHPRPGDWVVEISTIWNIGDDFDRLGRLVEVRDEVIPYESEEEADLNDHEVLTDHITYIERIDGSIARWHNCEFIRVLDDLSSEKLGVVDAVTLRDMLSRHGFDLKSPTD